MSIRKAKKQFFRNESKFLAKGVTCIDYISPNTVEYVVKKLSRMSKRKLTYYLYSEFEDDCFVIKLVD